MDDGGVNATVQGGQVGIAGASVVVVHNLNVGVQPAAPEMAAGDIPPCPYPGLAYFGPENSALFFGRDAAIAQLETAVAAQSLTALVGASGSGKSSVVLAGLAPRLHAKGGWLFTHFRVGTEADKNPFSALTRALAPLLGVSGIVEQLLEVKKLAAALQDGSIDLANVLGEARAKNPGKRILVIADQFEELFTFVADEALRHRFIDMMLAAFAEPSGLNLVMTLRADFYGQALRHRPLADALQGHVVNLGPMTREELRDAIVKPAGKVAFEPGLVDALLDDVGSRPGSLPLLQFALREMWRRLRTPVMSLALYREIGGVEGALAKRAQEIFDEATRNGANAQATALFRQLFTRLVTLGEGAEDTRRIVARDELGAEAWSLAQRLAGEDNRLVVTAAPAPGQETVEVVHEALIRNWPAMVDWVNRDRAFQSWLRQLKPRIDEWRANPGDEGVLLRGGPLVVADDWLARRNDDLNDEERNYLQTCRDKEAERRAAETERAQKLVEAERKAARRTRYGLAATSLLAALAIGAAVYGFRQAGVARDKSDEAERQHAIADQRRQEAEREAVKTAQRSAMLAAAAAKGLADEGSTDAALLLMLDAARLFDDTTAPDEIRIALTHALEKAARTTVTPLFPKMRAFETTNAIVLVDDATNDVYTLTTSAKPVRLIAGAPGDSPIKTVGENATKDALILVRDSLEVSQVKLAGGPPKIVGAFSPPTSVPETAFKPQDLSLTDSDLVVRTFEPTDANATGYYAEILDLHSGLIVEGPVPVLAFYRRDKTGALYIVTSDDRGAKVLPLTVSGRTFRTGQAKNELLKDVDFAYGRCIASMPRAAQAKAMEDIKLGTNFLTYACKQVGAEFLLTIDQSTSAGVHRDVRIGEASRSDTPNPPMTDLRETLAGLFDSIPRSNPTWVGLSLKSSGRAQGLAAIYNRDLFVHIDDAPDSQTLNPLTLAFRHPTPPTVARFLTPSLLAVVEADAGRLVLHDVSAHPSRPGSLYSTAADEMALMDKETPIAAFNHGTCVGAPSAPTETVRDGLTIKYDTDSSPGAGDAHALDVIDNGHKYRIDLGASSQCVSISNDWKRMLVLDRSDAPPSPDLKIYDFDRVLKQHNLTGAQIAAAPIRAPDSAFFAGDDYDLITTDYSNRVLRWQNLAGAWTSRELFHGENPVSYAEPDATGNRLAILERIGQGDVHGLFYSVNARQAWYDLGSDYKMLGVTFDKHGHLMVSKHGRWTGAFPVLPLDDLTKLARQNLSPQCAPPRPDQPRTSPCWPASFE